MAAQHRCVSHGSYRRKHREAANQERPEDSAGSPDEQHDAQSAPLKPQRENAHSPDYEVKGQHEEPRDCFRAVLGLAGRRLLQQPREAQACRDGEPYHRGDYAAIPVRGHS